MTTLKQEEGSGYETLNGRRWMFITIERNGETVSHDYIEETACGWAYNVDDQPRERNLDDNLGHILEGMSECQISALMETLWNGKETRI